MMGWMETVMELLKHMKDCGKRQRNTKKRCNKKYFKDFYLAVANYITVNVAIIIMNWVLDGKYEEFLETDE